MYTASAICASYCRDYPKLWKLGSSLHLLGREGESIIWLEMTLPVHTTSIYSIKHDPKISSKVIFLTAGKRYPPYYVEAVHKLR